MNCVSVHVCCALQIDGSPSWLAYAMFVLPWTVLSHWSPEAKPVSAPRRSLPSTPFQVTRPAPPSLRMGALLRTPRSSRWLTVPNWPTSSPSSVTGPTPSLAHRSGVYVLRSRGTYAVAGLESYVLPSVKPLRFSSHDCV